MFCRSCGAQSDDNAQFCIRCGATLQTAEAAAPPVGSPPLSASGPGQPKQKLVAALLGIVTCGATSIASWIWGIIDGVLILTGSLRTDAQGVPLRD